MQFELVLATTNLRNQSSSITRLKGRPYDINKVTPLFLYKEERPKRLPRLYLEGFFFTQLLEFSTEDKLVN